MSRRPATLVAMTIGLVTSFASSALANGVDLPTRKAMQGDEITVTGHAWLTCCPTNTPVEHVQLFLVSGSGMSESERVLLFDIAANDEGVISTKFTVPWVEPGRYGLEACGGLTAGSGPCLPEGPFTVLLGPPSPIATPNPQPRGDEGDWWLPAIALGLVGVATGVAYFWNRRKPTPN